MIEYKLTQESKNLETSQLISRHTVVCHTVVCHTVVCHTVVCHTAQEKGVCANGVGILTKKKQSCDSHSSVAL